MHDRCAGGALVIAVGLDPSLTCTGVAVNNDGEIITRRVRTPNIGTSLIAKRQRLRRAIEGTLTAVPARVDVTLIEIPTSTKQFGAHGERMAFFWWLVDQMFARGPVVAVSPSSRAKLATGNGRSSKDDVVTAIRAAFPDAVIQDDNVADAAALMWAGSRWAGIPSPDYLPEQEEAFSRLDWPLRVTTPAH
jgi:Holliday junction resolvasome RuvABC endonuclease subunit